MSAPDLNDFATRYAEAWCSEDPDAVAAFFAPDGWLSVNAGPRAVGRTAVAEVARGFMTAFPDIQVSFDRLVQTPESTEFHWTLTGTNTGPGGSGKHVRVGGVEQWQLGADGLIAESRGQFDAHEYARQLEYGYQG